MKLFQSWYAWRMAELTLARRGKRLEYFTIAWNSLEGVVAVIAGAFAGSISLVGFESTALLKLHPAWRSCGECRWIRTFNAGKGTKGLR